MWVGHPCHSAFHPHFKPEQTTGSERRAPYISEFLGTFLLVFVVASCMNSGDHTWTPTARAFTLMSLIFSVAHVSGGHLNPSVTLTMYLCGKVSLFTALSYMSLQILAGVFGGMLSAITFNTTVFVVAPVAPFGIYAALGMEAFYAMVICFVFVNVTGSKKKNPQEDPNQFFALAVGLTIIAGGYCIAPVSGGYMNPALTIGVDLAGLLRTGKLGYSFVYFVGQVFGALGATSLFYIFRHQEFSDRTWEELHDYKTTLTMRCAVEFAGTYVLVLTFGMCMVYGGTWAPWSSAAAYVSMIYAIGDISGGHFNPVVTLAVMLSGRGKMPAHDGIFYILSQLFAGLCCSLVIAHYHSMGPTPHTAYGLAPKEGYTWKQVGLSEFVFTGLLAFVFLSVGTAKLPPSLSTNQNFYYGLAIGSCILVGGFANRSASGGCLNPAVSLGLAVEESAGVISFNNQVRIWIQQMKMHMKGSSSSTTLGLEDSTNQTNALSFFFYSAVELAGGIFAVLLFKITHWSEYVPHGQPKVAYRTREAYAHYA